MSFFLFNLIEGVGEFVFNTIDLIKNWIDPKTQPKEGLKLQRKGSNLPIKLVYGTRTVGADIVDENTTDGSGGIKNEFYHVLAVFCHGEVEEIEEVFFNGVSWNDARWSKEGGGKWFTYELRKGGADNLTPMDGDDKFNRWSDITSLYEGLCVGIFTFEQAQDENIWQGEPQITARIKGKKCYDWRTDETIYTENPVVHLIDYIKSDVYGLGLSDSLIDYTNATIVANFCGTDHTAAVTKRVCEYDPVLDDYYCVTNIEETETFARFSHNNIIDTGVQVFDNVKEIATSFRGFFPDNNGLFSVATESEADSVFSFDDDNIIGAITTKTTSKNDKYNQVTVRFPNIENNFEMDEVIYPETDSATYITWLAEDNGVLLDHSITSETCVYKAEALQLAEVAAKVSRNNDQIGFTATALAMELDVGDVIDITNNTRGWVNKEFRIDSITENDDYTVTIAATLHNDSVYPWVDQTYNEYIGGSYLGNPNVIDAPTGLSITVDTTLATTGLLTWSHASNAFTRGYLVKAIVGGVEMLSQPCDTKSFTIPLLANGAYTFEVYARNTLGKTSTAGTLLATLAAPTTPTDLELIVSDWDISAKPILSGAGLGTVFDFDYVGGDGTSYTPSPKAQGYDVAITGLLPDTQYTIYTRAVNAFGTSAWYSESTTTTNTGEQVAPFIDAIQEEIDDAVEAIDNLESDVDVMTIDEINLTGQGISDAYQNYLRVDEIRTTNGNVDATITRVDSVEVTTSGNAASITTLEGQVNNPTTNGSAMYTAVQTAQSTADGNLLSINALDARVEANEDFASAQLVLNSEYDADLGTLSARAFLGTDVNDRVTGINIEGNPSNGTISFIGDKIEFLRPDDFSVAFQWVDVDDTFVFDGKIIATDSTFTGTITGTIINGGDITGSTIKSASTGQRVEIEGTTQKFFPATGTDYVSLDGETISTIGYDGDYITLTPSSGSGGLLLSNGSASSSTFRIDGDSLQVAYEGAAGGALLILSDDSWSLGFESKYIEVLSSELLIGSDEDVRVFSLNDINLGATDSITINSNSSSLTEYIDIEKDGQLCIRARGSSTPGTYVTLYENNNPRLTTTATGVLVDGTVTEVSDPSIKDFHRELDGKESLQMILDTELYEYTFKDSKKYGSGLQVGVDAMQAGSVFANSICISEDDLVGFNYKHAYIHGLAAIKQLKSEFDDVKAELNELKELIKGFK